MVHKQLELVNILLETENEYVKNAIFQENIGKFLFFQLFFPSNAQRSGFHPIVFSIVIYVQTQYITKIKFLCLLPASAGGQSR